MFSDLFYVCVVFVGTLLMLFTSWGLLSLAIAYYDNKDNKDSVEDDRQS